MKLKAELVPYDSKYYGTIVRVHFEDEGYYDLCVWDSGDSMPSIRQIKYRNDSYTQEDYDNNVKVQSYISHGEMGYIQDEIIPMDSHFESLTSYNKALAIIDKLNA